MKYLQRGLLAFFLVALGSTAPAQDLPSFRQVVTYYFKHYRHVPEMPQFLQFQKKKEGWVYVIEDMSPPRRTKLSVVFYSAAQRTFLPLPVAKRTNESAEEMEELRKKFYSFFVYDSVHAEYEYSRCRYFGYPGWSADMIREFGSREHLSDTLLEGLGRAYADYARGFFINENDRVYGESFRPTAEPDSFIKYERLAIVTFGRLKTQRPTMKVSVGNIAVKYAGELMNGYYTMTINGYEEKGRQFLEKGAWPDSLLKAARERLDSVGKAGILLAFMDNDTYPLLYVQEVEGRRRDVTVLNYTMLASRNYLLYLEKRFPGGALFRSTSQMIDKKNFNFVMAGRARDCAGTQDLGEWMDSIYLEKMALDKDLIGEDGIRFYRCRDLRAETEGGGVMDIHLRSYVIMPEFMVFDIYRTNLGKRQLYLTANGFDYFGKFLRKKGRIFYLRAG